VVEIDDEGGHGMIQEWKLDRKWWWQVIMYWLLFHVVIVMYVVSNMWLSY